MNKLFLVGAMCYSFLLQAQPTATGSLNEFENPDESAQYPGGLPAFYQDIRNAIVYPTAARMKGIEGKSFVFFVVSEKGFIEPNSIKALTQWNLDCNREAERAVGTLKVQWTPAKKDGKPIRQQLVIPIAFTLGDDGLKLNPVNNQLIAPIKTSVVAKPDKKATFGWDVYSDIEMKFTSARLLPGDSVEVVGWAPWLYMIQSKSVKGFMSYKSLFITPELKTLADVIVKESINLETAQQRMDSLRKVEKQQLWELAVSLNSGYTPAEQRARSRADSAELINKGFTFLHLTTSHKKLFVGQCAVVSLSFYVHNRNDKRLQFYDLPNQMMELIKANLLKDMWGSWNSISDVTGVETTVAGNGYTVYTIFSSNYCPMRPEPIVFNPMTLRMAQIKPSPDVAVEKVVPYTSKALSIAVSSLPEEAQASTVEFYKMVGKFMITDTLLSEKVVSGIPVTYKMIVQGPGLTFPLEAPHYQNENLRSKLIDEVYEDSIINDTYYSRKTFTYSLTFLKEGAYDFSNKDVYSTFDPKSQKVLLLKGGPKVNVVKGLEVIEPPAAPVLANENIIAIDASQSMMIEDYKPTRLKSVVIGLDKFMASRSACDIGLILFGGKAKLISPITEDSCYSSDLIRTIDHTGLERGTAIGNAIWLAIQKMPKSNSDKRLVLIGDGDNTAGIPIAAAVELAKKYRVKIYTIGVGNRGKVPFGRDENGIPNLVENTFSDTDFKSISLKTGGQYFWAKDAGAVTSILHKIFSL